MYEIKITLEVPEAFTALASALKARHTAAFAQNGENNQQIDNAGTVNIGKPAEVATPATADTPSTPTTAPTAEAKSYTVDDLSRAGAALIDQGKMPQLIELLKKYGVQAVTQLDASVYPAFVEEMKVLGAQL